MSTAPRGDVEAALAALSAEYAAGLDARIARLRVAMQGARGAGAGEALETARREAHRLRGTAASFGFGAIGAAAERLELALERFIEGRGELDACDDAFAELVALDALIVPP